MSEFTVTGGEKLDQLIRHQLDGIRDEVVSRLPRGQLDCLILGGGYGRGEGGALMTPRGQRPYNDYDLVLVHRCRDQSHLRATLASVHREQSARCGIHVDVTPIERGRLERLPPALTWYELGQGFKLVWGDPTPLSPLRSRTLGDVHPSEWGRLLVNRAAGVVFARRLLRGEPCRLLGDEDVAAFSHRQAMKAWLALGDVFLADRGVYHPLVQRRQGAFATLLECGGPDLPSWGDRYRKAQAFKLTPTAPPSLDVIVRELDELALHLRPALVSRPASPPRPAVGLYVTLRRLPWRVWGASLPWRAPRDRLRLALLAELREDLEARDRLSADAEGVVDLWERFG